MLGSLYRTILILLLWGVICNSCCSALYEENDAALGKIEKVLLKLEELSGTTAKVQNLEERLVKLEADVQMINSAISTLVYTLLEGANPEGDLKVLKKRDVVVSSNPLTNLPLSDLASLRGPAGKDGRDGKDGIAGGAVYTRWGRTTCGNESILLYSGFAGGSNFHQAGGGVNYQCMPMDPQYNKYYTGSGTWFGSYMAGVEYQSFWYSIFPKSRNDQNAPCARCYTNSRSAVMMIPAKRDCSEGWTKEYEGYLMTQNNAENHQTTFECMDESPEYISGEDANDNGAVLHFVRVQCDRGGHCPPYDGKKELTCVVCSK